MRHKKSEKQSAKKPEQKPNIKVVVLSIIALGFILLAFCVNWMFIIGAVIIMIINQRELLGKKR